jgi:DNA invertase Pin-like site-specific DNA recombinase
MTQAIAYMRCSGDAAIFGDTWDRQSEAINKYATAHDIEIVDWFRDEGVTGKMELENRPGLAACLERVENNGVHVMLCESADRLARDSMIAELIIRQFQKAKCQIISASGGVDLTAGDDSNPTAKLVRQVLAAVAEFDRCVTVLKLRAARQRLKAKNGKCEGTKAFGTLPGELDTLKLITTMGKAGSKPGDIAFWLNDNSVPTRYHGKRWHSGTVSKILSRHNQSASSALTKS